MKIVMAQPRLDRRGGAENLLLWLSEGLRDRGHEVAVVTSEWKPELWSGAFRDIPVKRLEPGFLKLRTRAGRARAYGAAMREVSADADLLVAHNYPSTAWAAAARRGDQRLVWYCHEPMQRIHWRRTLPHLRRAAESEQVHAWAGGIFRYYLRKLQRRGDKSSADEPVDRSAAAAMDFILANSAFTAGFVEEIYERPARVCHLGLPDPLAKSGRHKALTASAEPFSEPGYVAWIGSPLPYKNGIGVLEALRRARALVGGEDLKIRAVGVAGSDLVEPVRAAGLEQDFVIEPRLEYADLLSLIHGSRFLLYATIDEPFGIVPLEAMAQGRAVIASNLGGPCESVIDGETGLAVDPLDPDAVARAMVALWNDPGRCRALGAAGRRRFAAEFTLDAFLDRFLEAVG